MPIGFIFWVLMLLWFFLGAYGNRSRFSDPTFVGGGLVLFVLLFLLGWHEFGFVIHN